MRHIRLVGLVVAGALLAPAGASAAIPAPPVIPPGAIGPPTVAVAPLVPVCDTTPGVVLALTANPSANVNTVCAKYGAPLSPASAALRRAALRHHSLRSHATQVCVGAGCTYVWLFNEGGGWAYEESEAMPFPAYGHIEKGFADFARDTENDPYSSISNWAEDVEQDDGPGWYSDRYLYPICNSYGQCKNSWVSIAYSGQALVSGPPPITVGLGPVLTWNYITG